MADYLVVDSTNNNRLNLSSTFELGQFDSFVATFDVEATGLYSGVSFGLLGEDSTSSRKLELYGTSLTNITDIRTGTATIPLDTPIDISARSTIVVTYNDATNTLSITQDGTTVLAGANYNAVFSGPSGFDTLLRFGGGGPSDTRGGSCKLYGIQITKNGTPIRDFNPASALGTGLILPDDQSNADATLVNYAGDDSQWGTDAATTTLTLDLSAPNGGTAIPNGTYSVDFYNASSKAFISTNDVTFASGTGTRAFDLPTTTSIRYVIETGTHFAGGTGATV